MFHFQYITAHTELLFLHVSNTYTCTLYNNLTEAPVHVMFYIVSITIVKCVINLSLLVIVIFGELSD